MADETYLNPGRYLDEPMAAMEGVQPTAPDECWLEHRCGICGASWEADDDSDDRLLLTLLAAIREYPVELRMKAMGMRRFRIALAGNDQLWVEATCAHGVGDDRACIECLPDGADRG